ncbi:hypothetical protein CT676_39700 [Bradyrhizobium sp. MOS001]|uniref:hypothetical protein n=1 Tax=Bradyrhizobium sp. MOS001 TaxID=2133948 RepID=UPI001074DB5B|nr:hypothetical protein [Bradyrhizobium sp. MOS001]TFW54530.1 hypothetical protein CT676_39700 [Bradyrhizobium sp. MOS001]
MPEIEITDECRALIAAEFPSDDTGQRLASGKWQIQIDEVTWQMLQGTPARRVSIGLHHSRYHHHPAQARLAVAAANGKGAGHISTEPTIMEVRPSTPETWNRNGRTIHEMEPKLVNGGRFRS